jgi:hypothetical protein
MPHGPCVVCGETDYPMSCGGPSICPSCDCGVPPEVKKLRRENSELRAEILALHIKMNDGSIFKRGTKEYEEDPNRLHLD